MLTHAVTADRRTVTGGPPGLVTARLVTARRTVTARPARIFESLRLSLRLARDTGAGIFKFKVTVTQAQWH